MEKNMASWRADYSGYGYESSPAGLFRPPNPRERSPCWHWLPNGDLIRRRTPARSVGIYRDVLKQTCDNTDLRAGLYIDDKKVPHPGERGMGKVRDSPPTGRLFHRRPSACATTPRAQSSTRQILLSRSGTAGARKATTALSIASAETS